MGWKYEYIRIWEMVLLKRLKSFGMLGSLKIRITIHKVIGMGLGSTTPKEGPANATS